MTPLRQLGAHWGGAERQRVRPAGQVGAGYGALQREFRPEPATEGPLLGLSVDAAEFRWKGRRGHPGRA